MKRYAEAQLASVQRDKAEFVAKKLLPMLQAATHGTVADAAYVPHSPSDSEYVHIHLQNGEGFYVNVTCDSEWAIAKDVMRAVDKHY